MMLEPDGLNQHGEESNPPAEIERGRSLSPAPPSLSIPKNRSTSNLLANVPKSAEKARIRFSDAGLTPAEYDTMSRSPVMTEHEHGLGASGLRRIRQQPPPRAPTFPSSGSSSRNPSVGPRSGSMTLALPTPRTLSLALNSGPSSPTLNFTEDLTRFPSESLHSFSFAHQSEDFIHNRQNILKRSVEFMSQKLGWNANNAGIASAQARASGDQEMQGMLELLARAKLVGANNLASHSQTHLGGPLTGPAAAEDATNIFDMSFMPRSQSPEGIVESPQLSPSTTRKPYSPQESIPEQALSPKTRPGPAIQPESEVSSGNLTNETQTTAKTSPPVTRRQSLRRTYTDIAPLSLQTKLMDALAQPYISGDTLNDLLLSPSLSNAGGPASFIVSGSHLPGPAVHGHSSRWAPAAQAIFTTEITPPYTILAANDLACLVFGVTKAEVRKMGILEVVREERRAWLAERLESPGSATEPTKPAPPSPQNRSQQAGTESAPSFLLSKAGLTASLLSKPNSRQAAKSTPRRAQTDDGVGSSIAARKKAGRNEPYHTAKRSRGVLLCGDVVPIQKRNGATGSASLWVKEKRGGLIWVLEEIHEDVVCIGVDDDANVSSISGSTEAIWGEKITTIGMDIGRLLPRLPRQGIDGRSGEIDYAEVSKRKYFTARNSGRVNIPCTVERVPGCTDLQVSSFPHIAGIMVLSAETLQIASSNSVFSAALFGQEKPDGRRITDLIPDFDRMLKVLTEQDNINLVDGMVIPEHSFRRARAFLALHDGKEDTEAYFLRPDGLSAKHRDGSEIKIDAQLRVVQSDSSPTPSFDENVIEERSEEEDDASLKPEPQPKLVYALWITYSRYIHANRQNIGQATPLLAGIETPLHQPSPGQAEAPHPIDMDSDDSKKEGSHAARLAKQLNAIANNISGEVAGRPLPPAPQERAKESKTEGTGHSHKKSINDFTILEEMGQGAYGQVKLARYKKNGNRNMVLKYVTKRRILVDTWTRDRKLGTVPLEIHVLDYLRKDGLRHPNIVEMVDFFEDDVNYYIEMLPHGLPGMDLFDYIELRVNMTEDECRSIFGQVAQAIHHLHTKALVVHRDIKDENVVLDGEGNIKLIDFGSAAYTKNGPFDVFVGTIDYAAPEVLAGKPYRGKEQDVWALGILLYTIVYKENPFYSIDEIMDRDLRVPYIMSDDSIDLIRLMLDRDVDSRISIGEVLEHPWFRTSLA